MNVRYFASLKKTANMETPRSKASACESPDAVLRPQQKASEQ
jgi:hypothetical protein